MTTKAEVLKAVRFQCEECMGSMLARKREFSQEARNLVVGCSAPECSLYPFRMGKDPWPARKGSKEAMLFARSRKPVQAKKPKISTKGTQ
jgi:hypothetical protein